jgi:hypothetical protein
MAASGGGSASGQVSISGSLPVSAVGNIGTDSTPVALAQSGHYTFVVNKGANDVQVFDVSTPSSPILIDTFTTDNGPSGIAIQGHYAYVISSHSGGGGSLQIFDITNPSSVPAAVSDLATSQLLSYIVVSGHYAYVNTLGGIMLIIDFSNPANPVLINTTPTVATFTNNIKIAGSLVYLVSGFGNKVFVFNVSNPYTVSSPIATLDTGYGATGTESVADAAITPRYVYTVNDANNTLQVFDQSSLTGTITPIASVTTLSTPSTITVSGRYAYVTTNTAPSYLQVFDISNPASPVAVGSTVAGVGNTWALLLAGRYAYDVSFSGNELQILDLGGLYSQSVESGTSDVSSLSVNNNESIGGSSSIAGGLNVGQSLAVQGSLAVGAIFTPPNASSTNPSTDPSTCNTTTIPGAIYYNTTTATVRTCEFSAVTSTSTWHDLTTMQDLGILAFGVMPDSGANPGDLASVATPGVSGPCKVSWLTSASVSVSACTAYSGGRKVNVAATTLPINSPSKWFYIYVDPTAAGGLSKANVGGETNAAPTFSATAPLVNLANVVTGASGAITNIYDTRVFTTDTKSFTNMRALNSVGWVAKQFTNNGQTTLTTSTTDGNVLGVIVATTTGQSGGSLNAIIVTAGPVFVKANGTPTVNQIVIPSSTSPNGYATTSATANLSVYGNLGIAQLPAPVLSGGGGTTCNAPADCQYSELVDLRIR